MASRSGFRAANAKHIQGEVVDSVDAESLFLLASGRVDFGKGAELNVRHWSNRAGRSNASASSFRNITA